MQFEGYYNKVKCEHFNGTENGHVFKIHTQITKEA